MNTLVYKGKLLKVYEKKALLPNGFLARLEIVKHLGACLLVPFLTKDKIIMLRQYRPVIRRYLFELPAGTKSASETLSVCAHREMIEETGYAAGRIVRVGHIFPVPGYSTEKIVIFKALDLTPKTGYAEKDEVIKVFVVTRTKVKGMFKRGEIVDAKTICAFALCGWL